ncbi:MAG TPA: 3-oxoadipate enol-lactonase [Nocardioidaceae bacterium]|nr:3-oxoadipate enol-lactonase [Nocardioidaceae bacterium]
MTTSVPLAYDVQGRPDAPAVFLAPSLGTTSELFDDLAAALATSHHVVRFDMRGHGRSPAPHGPYTMAGLADDVVALADRLGIARFAVLGLSLGGCIAQQLALSHPERLSAAVLCCTLPKFGEPAQWHDRAASVRADGMAVLDEGTRLRWFTEATRTDHPEVVEHYIDMLAATPVEGYAACCEALAGFDATDRLAEVGVPTRVIAGSEDPVATVELAGKLAAPIPGADLVVIEDASHIACAEQPDAFHAAVAEHLDGHQ